MPERGIQDQYRTDVVLGRICAADGAPIGQGFSRHLSQISGEPLINQTNLDGEFRYVNTSALIAPDTGKFKWAEFSSGDQFRRQDEEGCCRRATSPKWVMRQLISVFPAAFALI
jgi:hypothetical protein